MTEPAPDLAPLLDYASPESQRLDHFLTACRPQLSRMRWQTLIREGKVLVNGKTCKPNHALHANDRITWSVPPAEPVPLLPEDIPLAVLYEDADLIVINKQAGLVVHPAPGHERGTLVNALLHHCTDLPGIGGEIRPGLVHRLDRDTSGCLVAAKSEAAVHALTAQFKDRTVDKEYLALVWGTPAPAAGTIHTRIARSPRDRKKMAVLPLDGRNSRLVRSTGWNGDDYDEDDDPAPEGREAISHYATEERLGPISLVRVHLETGRTHQIRVHLAHLRHAVVGDAVYGRDRPDLLPAPAPRQMLHAEKLAFTHPTTGERMAFTAPLPPDFAALLTALRAVPQPPSKK